MEIVNLTEDKENLYKVCLEDWSDEMKEGLCRKDKWYGCYKNKGLRVKLAKDDEGKIGGMIQYLPVEHYFPDSKDMYYIMCIWVHNHKKGRGDFTRKGMGKALLKAAEEDAKVLGAKAMVAWGVSMPFWMRAKWYKKQGYTQIDKESMAVLLWKPFTDGLTPPTWLKKKKDPKLTPGKVTVTVFSSGWCSAQNAAHERSKRAAKEFGDKVEYVEIDTTIEENLLEWGIADGVYIDQKEVRTGPPPSYEKIKKQIAKKVKKLR